MKTVYKLLKENLGKAEMLTYVFAFNASSWVEELNFVQGQNDKAQWNVSIGPTVQWSIKRRVQRKFII